MPKGYHLNRNIKRLLTYFVMETSFSVEQIAQYVFQAMEIPISMDYLWRLCLEIRNMSNMEREMYKAYEPPPRNVGRVTKLDNIERNYLLNMLQTRKYSSMNAVYEDYITEVYGEHAPPAIIPSYRTVCREIAKAKYTKKAVSKNNLLVNHQQRLDYLLRIESFNPLDFIDVDETAASEEEIARRYGLAPRGEPAYCTQIRIGNRSFSVIAAYTPFGFLCWQIVEGTFNSHNFMYFIQSMLSNYLTPNSCVLLDNASVHKTEEAIHVIENATNGQYEFVPAYSPDLKPIEKGFANIKWWLRTHENQHAHNDPIGFIDMAFRLYSVANPHGFRGRHAIIAQLYVFV